MNIDRLNELINNFQSSSNPSNADSSAHCTNADIRKVVSNISDLLRDFVAELSNDDTELY